MAQLPVAAPGAGRVSFRWIIDRRSDLTWYIGSALAGWLYAGIILAAVALLADPMQDAFGVLRLGGLEVPLTLRLLVYTSWAFLLDAPHLWATLARTFFDPDERVVRRRELWLSWAWFLLGPALILAPYLVDMLPGVDLSAGVLSLGGVLFVLFFRLWAYYHVVRQHWGFLALYRRKNGETDGQSLRVDAWCFNLALYTPLVMFVTAPYFASTPGMPSLGLEGLAVTPVLHVATWVLYLGTLCFYAGYQVRRWRRGQPLNGPKLLFLLLVLPLHLAAFSSPWLAAMLVPLVTVGHNLQYHRIVWMYGRNKYQEGRYGLARAFFSRAWVYAATGLLFTFALYRGPWIDWLQRTLGITLDSTVFAGVGMMAGLADPSTLGLGQQLFGAFLLGWAMQHYYLDAKIWRVGRDRAVARQLNLDA